MLRKVKSYTARRLAGPSRTAVNPSTVTVAASLAAYLESPLLYSFPAQKIMRTVIYQRLRIPFHQRLRIPFLSLM
jgi:hypothetical protein